MKYLATNSENNEITLILTRQEIQDLILYLGHGRYAKGLDRQNYENLGWKEAAKVAKSQCNEIDAAMKGFNDILNEAYK